MNLKITFDPKLKANFELVRLMYTSVMLKSLLFGADYPQQNSHAGMEARNMYEQHLWNEYKIGQVEFITYDDDSDQRCIGFYILNGGNRENKNLFLQLCSQEIQFKGPEVQRSSLTSPLKSIYYTWEKTDDNQKWLRAVLERFGKWNKEELENFITNS
ncbi:MAG: hypothetical protein ACMG6E_02725 [Candidatus Roizmanbacteria bacterium]